MRVAVIGAGMAGCAAALEARASGAEVDVFHHRPGATSCGGGLFDLAPLRPDEPIVDGIGAFLQSRPHHPYAVLHEEEPAERVVAETARLLRQLLIFQSPAFGEPGKTTALTDGSVRLASALQQGVVSFEAGQTVGVGGWTSRSAGQLRAWAQVLSARIPECSFVPVPIEFYERSGDSSLSEREQAALVERPSAQERIAQSVQRSVGAGGVDVLLLPQSLGFSASQVSPLSERVGLEIRELADAGGGLQGLRLQAALHGALDAAGCDLLHRSVDRIEPGSDAVVVHVDGEQLVFDSAVVAAGTLFGGGLQREGTALQCPIVQVPAQLPVRSPPGALAPHFAGGLPWDRYCRVLNEDGQPWSERVFAAGSLLYGLDPTDGSGYGACMVTGMAAGRQAAGAGQTEH